MKPQPIGWQTALIALGVCLVRGGNQVALKVGLTALAPFWTAYWRMQIGLLTVGAWALLRGVPLRPERQEWRSLAQLSLLFFVQIAALHYGADFTSPAYAVILMNSNPIFANLIAHFIVPADRLSAPRAAGLALAFAGVAAVMLGRPDPALAPDPIRGNTVVMISALLVGVRLVYTQHIVQRIEPVKTVFWQMLITLPLFWLAAILGSDSGRQALNLAAIIGVVYQGVMISGLSFIVWATLLRKHSPGSLSVFSFTVPIFGVLFSAWLLSEPMTLRLVLGVAGVSMGIGLATQAGRKAALLSEEGDVSSHHHAKHAEPGVRG